MTPFGRLTGVRFVMSQHPFGQSALEPVQDHLDAEAFRRAMRNPACAVAIVAASGPSGRAGITATAVCSLSDSPPAVLACINRSSWFYSVINEAESFSINYLSAEQVDLAKVFAGRAGAYGEARFADDLWTASRSGAPVLVEALASFSCYRDGTFEHSTHTLFVGRVVEVISAQDRESLVYSRGNFFLPRALDQVSQR
jgi:flavin reductase